MKVSLDLHDWSVVNNRMDLLLKLKERFSGFKVSLFTVPVDTKQDWGPYLIREETLKKVIWPNLDWIQIIPHGYRHNGAELRRSDYGEFKRLLPDIQAAFDNDRLPYVKGFCAPHWAWSPGVVKVLDEEGWWGAIDPRHSNALAPRKIYRYSHALDTLFSGDIEILKLHGHVYGTRNDLGRCFWNILNVPLAAEWHFVTDFLEDR